MRRNSFSESNSKRGNMAEKQKIVDRRYFLKTAGYAIASAALASGPLASTLCAANVKNEDEFDKYDFIMPRVKFTHDKKEVDKWNTRPGGDANLLEELASIIRCKVKPIKDTTNWEPQYASEGQLNGIVTFEQPEKLKNYPFLFMTGENRFVFTAKQKRNLKEYIIRGGFMLMDDCVVGSGGDFFYKSAYKILEEVFGTRAIQRIPREHEVFHNVYDLGDTGLPQLRFTKPQRLPGPRPKRPGQRSALPYMHGQNHGARGVFIDDRLAIFLSSTDIHCGWCDRDGDEFGRESYEKAIQMGINIIMYAISH